MIRKVFGMVISVIAKRPVKESLFYFLGQTISFAIFLSFTVYAFVHYS